MGDCVIVLKSGAKIKVKGVNWNKVTDAINQAGRVASTKDTFLIWDDLLFNLNEIAAIYLEGVGIKDG